ncbi:MAG: dTDP-4-dehydrorhamnose reductase [Blastocatellia bacterium]|nr:dTDP-4-dehydrorhamnose reductase [Blastocatellia bacterium]
MKKVLITGRNGLLGKTLSEKVGNSDELLALDRQSLDITNKSQVDQVVVSFRPDLIINSAAIARVDMCETERELAWAVNATGAGYLAEAAEAVGAEIMHISTDYVFDGSSSTPYTIEDKPEPISAYGESKLDGEKAVMKATDRHYIVRVARLFGSGGSNFGSRIFDHISKAVESSSPMKVFGYPLSQATYLPDLADRLLKIAEEHNYGVYHTTNSGPIVGWVDFTKIAVQIMGITEPRIEQVEYIDLGLPALRPQYSGLRCLMAEKLSLSPLRDWREALEHLYKVWKT